MRVSENVQKTFRFTYKEKERERGRVKLLYQVVKSTCKLTETKPGCFKKNYIKSVENDQFSNVSKAV